MRCRVWVAALLAAVVVSGCQGAREHAAAVNDAQADGLTVGKVQREIRVGMSGAEVATVMGSPNVVSSDEQRREVWIYDKISTTSAYSNSSGGVSALILGGFPVGSGVAGGLGSAGYNGAAGAASTSQRTLTVIVKFDNQGLVRDFSYHSSSF